MSASPILYNIIFLFQNCVYWPGKIKCGKKISTEMFVEKPTLCVKFMIWMILFYALKIFDDKKKIDFSIYNKLKFNWLNIQYYFLTKDMKQIRL